MGAADDLVKRFLDTRRRKPGSGAPGGTADTVLPKEPKSTVLPEVPDAAGSAEVLPEAPKSRMLPEAPEGAVFFPAVCTKGAVLPEAPKAAQAAKAVLAPAASAPVRKFLRNAPELHSDRERSLRDEKVEFVRLVEECKVVHHLSDQLAVLKVAAEKSDLFPLLATAGKNGKSALHYNNLRNWRDGRVGKNARPGLRNPVTGKVDYSRADLLLANYGAGEFRRYGDDRFWTAMLAACNNLADGQISLNYRLLVREWMKHSPSAEIPSLAQVYREIRRIPERMLQLNRKGPAWYLQHKRDYNERDPDSIRPNEAWVGDTQMLDFMIRVKTGVDAEGRDIYAAQRPWICVIMDVKSEHVLAWELGIGSINNQVIRNAFGRAVWEYGRPFIFQTDNGKDYLKLGFTRPVVFTPDIANSKVYRHSILEALEIEHRKAEAYNGRAKIVERFFSCLAKYYHTCRGYVGNSPAARPATAEVWAKENTCEALWNVAKACSELAKFIEIYHATPAKGSKFLRGKTPDEAFAEELRVQRPRLSMAELYRRFLLPEAKPRIMDPRGSSVTVDGKRYVTIREDREKMWKYDGRPVMVKFDLASRDYCFLFDLDGTFLTAAHRPQMIPYFCRTPEEKALLAQSQEWIKGEIKTLNTYTEDLTHGFHKLDVSTSFGLPPEEFEGRARLRKLDSKHSVKGETHNPAVYVTAAEYAAAKALKAADIADEKKLRSGVRGACSLEMDRDIDRILQGEEIPMEQEETAPVRIELPDLADSENNDEKRQGEIDDEDL